MKKTLTIMATLALLLSLSSPARASAFLSITNGVTTKSCDNSSAAGVTACTNAGFLTVLGSNDIGFTGSVGGYNIASITLTGNQPGTSAEAHAIDTKTSLQNASGGSNPLVVQFSESDYSLP